MLSTAEAKQRLIDGNTRYLEAVTSDADISPALRRSTAEHGKLKAILPYALPREIKIRTKRSEKRGR